MNSPGVLTVEDFHRYIEAFNRSDFEAFGHYYAPGIHFQGQGGEFHSREEVLRFYRKVKSRLCETITVRGLVVGKRDIVADLETELYALEDWPDFPTGAIRAGETRRSENFVWYGLDGGTFDRVRSARYRSIPSDSGGGSVAPAGKGEEVGARERSDRLHDLPMSEGGFRAYIDAFNRDEVATYGGYYDEDVVLVIAGKTQLRGRQAIFDFYRVVKSQTQRTLQVNKFVAAPGQVAVELESEFLALQDLPDFTAGPMKRGGRIFINTFVLYDLHGGKFTRIRSAQFRKLPRT
jgi:hypothetical protein